MGQVRSRGTRFIDEAGRQVLLRGVNLGGDCKVPYPDGGTDRPSDFSDHREVSFVGRPFPLDEANEHLGRLRGWGFNCLRLLTTWEAVEHAGPGRYDAAYLDYLAEVVRRAGEHELQVFIDFHQDVWSRMSGGDGAPGWVFEALGLDFTRFGAAGAAHVMQNLYDYSSPVRRQEDRYPMMTWSRNYQYPVNGICWTAFFAGRTFTPDWNVGGRNVQDFLQDHYRGAMRAVAERVAGLDNVMGFDSLNEPGSGWSGQRLSQRHTEATPENPRPPRPGPVWSPLDGLAVAAGLPARLPVMGLDPQSRRMVVADELEVNAGAVRIWLDDGPDPFERAGIWKPEGGEPLALREDAFVMAGARKVDHENDFMAPFMADVTRTVREVRGDWLLFAELDPFAAATGHGFGELPPGSVNANHWYDIRTLGLKTFDVNADAERTRARYIRQLGQVREVGERAGAPTLIGEFGIPYDLNGGEAYEAWARGERWPKVWEAHEKALSLMYDAMDALLISSTQWNYTASNRNDLRVGDGWNQEDLSIFSRDQEAGPDDGGRAVRGFARPYVRAAQGRIVSQAFDWESGVFTAEIDVDPAVKAPSEIVAPAAWFPTGGTLACDGAGVERDGDIWRVSALGAGRLRLHLA
ncbi:cellulase family glycosylhydrolase [Phenylobacterium sp.]|uniref:cellulase family glycosylhydrolase n=1 Tax=Phenylobacterium sp. TaxID=1871053 RepID=UPI0035B0BD14